MLEAPITAFIHSFNSNVQPNAGLDQYELTPWQHMIVYTWLSLQGGSEVSDAEIAARLSLSPIIIKGTLARKKYTFCWITSVENIKFKKFSIQFITKLLMVKELFE